MNQEDINIRNSVPEHLENHLRLYRRLYLARLDLEEAKAALDEILQSNIPIPKNEMPPSLLLSLTTALVVAYSRPWVYSRGQSIVERTVPGALLKTLTANQRQIHDYLINLRNKEVAHSDADILDIHLMLYPDDHSAILRTSREAFTRGELKEIRGVIKKLEKAIEKELRGQVLPFAILTAPEYDLPASSKRSTTGEPSGTDHG